MLDGATSLTLQVKELVVKKEPGLLDGFLEVTIRARVHLAHK